MTPPRQSGLPSSLWSLEGRHALVSGASGTLGMRFCDVLGAAGARVSGTGRSVDADRLRALRGRLGERFRAHELDVTDVRSIDALFDGFDADGDLPDILVNNAGIATSTLALATGDDDWRRVMSTNLDGPRRLLGRWARGRVEAGVGGVAINVCSILASRTMPGTAPYASAKAGLLHLTRVLALEWARHGIRVNSLSPGYIETEINGDFFASEAGQRVIKRMPTRTLGQPEDLDGALLLLASDASRHMTGAEIVVDGGHSIGSL